MLLHRQDGNLKNRIPVLPFLYRLHVLCCMSGIVIGFESGFFSLYVDRIHGTHYAIESERINEYE